MHRDFVASAFVVMTMLGGFACGAMLGDAVAPPTMQEDVALVMSGSGSHSAVGLTSAADPPAALSVAENPSMSASAEPEEYGIIGLLSTSPDSSGNMWGYAPGLASALGPGGLGVGSPSASVGLGRRPSVPKILTGATTVSGRLPPEVVQRIIRQNNGRFRFCYEQALANNHHVQGRVSVRFVIGANGDVQSVSNAGSDFPDPTMVACIVRAFRGLSFPRPNGGIVTVVYPISFKPETP